MVSFHLFLHLCTHIVASLSQSLTHSVFLSPFFSLPVYLYLSVFLTTWIPIYLYHCCLLLCPSIFQTASFSSFYLCLLFSFLHLLLPQGVSYVYTNCNPLTNTPILVPVWSGETALCGKANNRRAGNSRIPRFSTLPFHRRQRNLKSQINAFAQIKTLKFPQRKKKERKKRMRRGRRRRRVEMVRNKKGNVPPREFGVRRSSDGKRIRRLFIWPIRRISSQGNPELRT